MLEFDETLADKREIIAFSQCDDPDNIELYDMIKSDFLKKFKNIDSSNIIFFSSFSSYNLDLLKSIIIDEVLKQRKILKDVWDKEYLEDRRNEFKVDSDDGYRLYDMKDKFDSRRFDIIEEDKIDNHRVFCIHGARINQIAIMTNYQQSEAVDRLWDIFRKIGVWNKLDKLGADTGDIIKFIRSDVRLKYRLYF